MMKHRLPYFLILFTFLFAAPVLGGDEPLSCADKSVTASAVRTQEDIQAFVQCAYEFVQEMGFEEARRAFNEDERWKSGQIYVFVAEATPMSDMSRVFVFPPDPSREGEPWGLLIDIFGNDWFREQHRIVNQVGEGWIYYSFTNPATGRDEPKASYLKSIDWDGALATIGAGVYRRDLPGTCQEGRGQRHPDPRASVQPKAAGICPLRRHGVGDNGIFWPRLFVHRSALEEPLDLPVWCGHVRQHALYRQPLQLGDGHKPFGVDHHRCPG